MLSMVSLSPPLLTTQQRLQSAGLATSMAEHVTRGVGGMHFLLFLLCSAVFCTVWLFSGAVSSGHNGTETPFGHSSVQAQMQFQDL